MAVNSSAGRDVVGAAWTRLAEALQVSLGRRSVAGWLGVPSLSEIEARIFFTSFVCPHPFQFPHFLPDKSGISLPLSLSSSPISAVMLSRRVLVASRFVRSSRAPQLRYPNPVIQQFRSYADKIVKVPQMAESISEGTLKQWSKQVGDYVELDEEIATIETDKVSYTFWAFAEDT